MYYLDFFNTPPQYSIFQKEKNQTQFGGVLFLIYIIVMLFICFIYIMDYAINEKYEIEYLIIDSLYDSRNVQDRMALNFDQAVNQMTQFRIRVEIYYQKYIDDEKINITQFVNDLFMYYNHKYYKGSFCDNTECLSVDGDISYINFDINKTVYDDVPINIYLKCHDENCSNYNSSFFKSITVMTQNFEIIHNSSEPIKINNCFDSYEGVTSCVNSYETSDIIKHKSLYIKTRLSTIVYEEKKGISSVLDYITNKKNSKIIAFIDPKESEHVNNNRTQSEHDYDGDPNDSTENEEENYEYENEYEYEYENEYLARKNNINSLYNIGYGEEEIDPTQMDVENIEVARIDTEPISKYQKYRRSEIGFLTVLANIGALFSTLKAVITIFFSFYSKNFDNYKIVEKIIKQELYEKRQIKLDNINNNNADFSKINLENKNKKMPLMSDFEKEDNNNDITESINDLIEEVQEEDENKDKIKNKRILPKLSFFDFFLNNVYMPKCNSKKQEMLNICNNIVLKYISIDAILSNHLRLENLFKDYVWNNPELNNILKNENIIQLLKLI